MHTRTIACWLVLPLAVLGGCADVGYYAQAVNGQIEVWRRSQPIERVIAHPGTSPALKNRLSNVLDIREFACREMHLPDSGSYLSYADLERPYVIWNVFAAPELSAELKTWCFPIAGCVSYRGYFSEQKAEQFAAGLREQGYDTYVSGVPAYSTLGWFDDPVLSTFLHYSETSLAGLIFHELAHEVVYVGGDSVFNESFATAVETEGVRRWFDASGSTGPAAAHEAAQRRRSDFIELVLDHRNLLEELYASELSDTQKRASKARILEELRSRYDRLKRDWGGYVGFDAWFAKGPNNAQLASVAAYTQLVPAFRTLLARHDNDLIRFYAAVRRLGRLPKVERDARLRELMGDDERLAGSADRPEG